MAQTKRTYLPQGNGLHCEHRKLNLASAVTSHANLPMAGVGLKGAELFSLRSQRSEKLGCWRKRACVICKCQSVKVNDRSPVQKKSQQSTTCLQIR